MNGCYRHGGTNYTRECHACKAEGAASERARIVAEARKEAQGWHAAVTTGAPPYSRT